MKTASESHLDVPFHCWHLSFLTHFSMHTKEHIWVYATAVLWFFCCPLGLITVYKIFHPKATRCNQYRLWMIFPCLCSALHGMTWSQSSSLWISVYITIPISISSHQQICWHIEPFYHFPFTNHCFGSSLVTWLCDPSQDPCRAFFGHTEHRYWELSEQHPSWALWDTQLVLHTSQMAGEAGKSVQLWGDTATRHSGNSGHHLSARELDVS